MNKKPQNIDEFVNEQASEIVREYIGIYNLCAIGSLEADIKIAMLRAYGFGCREKEKELK